MTEVERPDHDGAEVKIYLDELLQADAELAFERAAERVAVPEQFLAVRLPVTKAEKGQPVEAPTEEQP